ncbi:anti-sigma factor domain-containing protein [Pseudalkalibacillus hwajinpoensis]|uniref:anti-sigma factor domain-containing protein n=1 Tax=Guptibacillus hwajinpoensis TaxID=208199 RepID=UPI001CD39935|nr:anti-sigma factor domain-containing protein [Pseudalkalibacillus hwajinpoensis]MCA0991814.1 anti-sigma factor domain-containing protein [Pseudalkalibacillus hwajinpoensis]
MKKGVIMDIRGRKAVVLTPDGEFSTINLKRNHTLTIGSEIKLAPKPLNKKKGYFTPSMPTLAGMAAILLLVVIVTGVIPVRQNDVVAAYVSFDINPSIEVGVNSDLEVIQYQAWNSDGEGLNLERDTMNMPLSEFGGLLVSKLDNEGYLEEGRELLIVASNVEAKESKGITGDLEAVIRGIENNHALVTQAVAITTILDADFSMREKAIEHGISQGKYMAYLAAVDRGASLSMDEVRNLSVEKMDEMQPESMTAAEAKESEVPDESKVKDPQTPIEDSVVQLNDKKVPDQEDENGELILKQPEKKPVPESKNNQSNNVNSNEAKKTNSSNGTRTQKDDKEDQHEKEKQDKPEKKTETKVEKEQEKEKKQAAKQNSKIDKAQEKAEKKDEKEQEKAERKSDKSQEKSEKKDEKAQDKEEKKSEKAPKKEDPENNKGKSEEKKKDS